MIHELRAYRGWSEAQIEADRAAWADTVPECMKDPLMTDADQLLALATRLNKAATEISKQVTEIHDVADELAAMAENGGVEPPDPEPPAEGAYPADPASWTVTNLVDATQHSLALPVELRGPGLVVASFSGEHATKLELGALDGFTGTDPAVLAGNTLRLYHRALAANERLNMLTLLVSPAEWCSAGSAGSRTKTASSRLPRSAPLRPTPARSRSSSQASQPGRW